MKTSIILITLEQAKIKRSWKGFPGSSVMKSTCQCKGLRFNSWSRRFPYAMEQLGLCATTMEPAPQSPGTADYWARMP